MLLCLCKVRSPPPHSHQQGVPPFSQHDLVPEGGHHEVEPTRALKAEMQDVLGDLVRQVASVAALLPDRVPVTEASAGILEPPADGATEVQT